MKYDLFAPGFPFVEFVRVEQDIDFRNPGTFIGPFASADVCILVDVAAKLGLKSCFAGPVGDDEFGQLVRTKMEHDGVDVRYMRTVKGTYTGLIFVRYNAQGEREYLEILNGSSYHEFNDLDVHKEAITQSRCVHFSGELIDKCRTASMETALQEILSLIPAGTLVSFDPNFTDDIQPIRERFAPYLERADIVFPSQGEAAALLGMDDDEACMNLARQGKLVAQKRGSKGCRVYLPNRADYVSIPAFIIDEVDPTGSGDSFCAGFLYGVLQGWTYEESGLFANAAGAIQASTMGPMEGILSWEEVQDFIKSAPLAGTPS